jgi:hypothetical protein
MLSFVKMFVSGIVLALGIGVFCALIGLGAGATVYLTLKMLGL